MTVIKYSLLNIKANKKPHIAIFLISVVVIFLLLCTSSMHEQVTSVMESDLRFNEYAAVAIRPISPTQIVDNNADLTDEHIARFSDSEYVVNFYAFTQLSVGSNSLYPTTVPFERALQASLLPMFDRQFELIIYSDIHMSTHFVLGDRKLAQGRFAENTTESMVSSEMADKNNLAVGDFISIYTSHHAPGKLTFEIVGIYYDFSADIGNELNLVLPRLYEFRENPEPGIDFTFRTEWASRNNLSRNQILTVASSSAEQTSLRMRGLFGGQQNAPVLPNDWGYDVVVFYVRDEQSIPAFIHSIEDILHEHHTIFDSGDMLRYISNTLDFTQRTFALLLTGALAAGALIYITSVLYVLKLRTYDIGVFRTLGCSRFYTAALLSLEFAIISLLAFVVAGLAYIATFGTIATAVFDFQYRFNPASWFHSPQEERATAGVYDFINWQRIIEGTQDFVFAPEAGLLQLLVGLLAVMLFTVIIGIIASLFIVRNEPMKTMKEF